MSEETTEYKCDVCGATFKDGDALAKHQEVHQSDSENEPLEQGTQTPTQGPSISSPGSPGPMLANA
jgi:DNA-directed RNA polymerase subunit RPC12/RpoP